MWIIGCDFHSRYQQIAAVDTDKGESLERRLDHEGEETVRFYSSLPRGALVGMEAGCPAQWFERLLEQCGHRLVVGDPAAIRASVVRKQKTDRRDAQQLLLLLRTDRFPCVWVPSPAERDLRQLLLHRHKLVCWRTQLANQLSAMARGQGVWSRSRRWNNQARARFQSLSLDPWATHRRQNLLQLFDQLSPQIDELTQRVEQEARSRPPAADLMQLPGIGPVTSLTFVLTLGTARRFPRGKQVGSYLGLQPIENSSGDHQKFGHISKQGNAMMRFLLVEAAWAAVRSDPELRRFFKRLAFRRGRKIAIVATARKLAVKLYWRLRLWEETHPTQPPAPMQGSSGRGVMNAVCTSIL